MLLGQRGVWSHVRTTDPIMEELVKRTRSLWKEVLSYFVYPNHQGRFWSRVVFPTYFLSNTVPLMAYMKGRMSLDKHVSVKLQLLKVTLIYNHKLNWWDQIHTCTGNLAVVGVHIIVLYTIEANYVRNKSIFKLLFIHYINVICKNSLNLMICIITINLEVHLMQ